MIESGDFANFTDNCIEAFFASNSYNNNKDFFNKLDQHLKLEDHKLNESISLLTKQNEKNSKEVQLYKDMYKEKLDIITNLFNNYELKVDSINQYYSTKLGYISNLSSELTDFENFDKNIGFAQKVFEYIQLLNTSSEAVPDIFIDSEKVVDEGLEIFEAIKVVKEAIKKDSPVLMRNYKIIELKIQESLLKIMTESYENNDLAKLEKLFLLTDKSSSSFLVDLYCKIVIDQANLQFHLKSIKSKNYKDLSKDCIKEVEISISGFNALIVKTCETQFGSSSGKMFILFPENQQKVVISQFFLKIANLLTELRESIVDDQDKPILVSIKLIEIISLQTLQLTSQLKPILVASRVDIATKYEQETRVFMRNLEGIYMGKEQTYYEDKIIKQINKDKYEQINTHKMAYNKSIKHAEKEGKSKLAKQQIFYDFQESLIMIINPTNFSFICREAEDILKRMNKIMANASERIDFIQTFVHSMIESLSKLLEFYCDTVCHLISELERHDEKLNDSHYLCFLKLNYLLYQISDIFTKELRSVFKVINILDEVEDAVIRKQNISTTLITKVYNLIESRVTSIFSFIMSHIQNKTFYKNRKKGEAVKASSEIIEMIDSVMPLFNDIINSWPEQFKNKISQLLTKTIYDKMIDLLKNSNLGDAGAKSMKIDFNYIFTFFDTKLDKVYSNRIFDALCLVDILMLPEDSVDSYINDLISGEKKRYDENLLKLLSKRRKALKY